MPINQSITDISLVGATSQEWIGDDDGWLSVAWRVLGGVEKMCFQGIFESATVYTTCHHLQNTKNYCTLLLPAMIDIHVFNNSNRCKIPKPKLPEWHTSDIWIPNLSVICIYINFCTSVCWYIHRSKNLICIQSRLLKTNTTTHNQLLKQTHMQCSANVEHCQCSTCALEIMFIFIISQTLTSWANMDRVAIFEGDGSLNPEFSQRRVPSSLTISARLDRTVNALQLCLLKFSHIHTCYCWLIYIANLGFIS